MRHSVEYGSAFGRVRMCVCVCICPVHALTFKRFDLETSFLVSRYTSEYVVSCLKVIGSRSRSQEQKWTHVTTLDLIFALMWLIYLRLQGSLFMCSLGQCKNAPNYCIDNWNTVVGIYVFKLFRSASVPGASNKLGE